MGLGLAAVDAHVGLEGFYGRLRQTLLRFTKLRSEVWKRHRFSIFYFHLNMQEKLTVMFSILRRGGELDLEQVALQSDVEIAKRFRFSGVARFRDWWERLGPESRLAQRLEQAAHNRRRHFFLIFSYSLLIAKNGWQYQIAVSELK